MTVETERGASIVVAAEAHADRVAVVTRDESVSYRELAALVDAVAGAFVAASIEAGEPMLLVLDNRLDSLGAFHAALLIGAVVVAVPSSSGTSDVGHAIAATGARVGWGPADLVEALRTCHAPVHWLSSDEPNTSGASGLGAARALDPDARGLVLFTSGTIDRPKGVVHSRRSLHAAAVNFADALGLTSQDRLFLVSPLTSITGVLQAMWMAPSVGAAVVLEDHFDAARSLELIAQSGATIYGGPDVVLARLFEVARAHGMDDIGLRTVALGGTMLDATLLDEAEQRFGIRVTRAYGSSEAPFSTATDITADRDTRHGSDGHPLAGVEIRIGTAHDPGELALRGPHVMLGYLDDDDNADAFEDGWYRTGDVAERAAAGEIRIVGRIKDVAIRNGVKIALAEVERAVRGVDGVADCVAYRVADTDTGEHVGVAVVATREITIVELHRALLDTGLTKTKLPEELVWWRKPIPLTLTGKVRRADVAGAAARMRRHVVARLMDGPDGGCDAC